MHPRFASTFDLPLSVRAWYQSIFIVIPSLSPQAAVASRSKMCLASPFVFKTEMHRRVAPEALLSRRAPVTEDVACCRVPAENSMSCECFAHVSHPLLSNSIGNLVVRHPWQCETLFALPYVLGCNARNRLWHSARSLWEVWTPSKSQIHECLFLVQDAAGDKVEGSFVFADAFECVQLYNCFGLKEASSFEQRISAHNKHLLLNKGRAKKIAKEGRRGLGG